MKADGSFWVNGIGKCMMIILIVAQSLCSSAQCCTYTLSMHDSYGDGWNGGHLEVYINTILYGDFSATNFASTSFIDLCEGDALELVYSSGDYENENTYQLLGPGYNVLFSDGPDPQIGTVFSYTASCEIVIVPGGNPCTAIPLILGECADGDNTNSQNSGLNPGCANFQGADFWFNAVVPESGNISLVTQNGGLSDTGLAAWRGSDCSNLQLLGCDDDAGEGYYSFLLLYDLTPGDAIYLQVFGYGGGTGAFQLCSADLGTVTLESSELPIVMINTLDQSIQNDVKIDALLDIKYNGAGDLTYVTDSSNVYSGNIGIEIRGATSASFPQAPYGFETRDSIGGNNDVSLLEMPSENDWVLISNYNDFSFIRNTLSTDLFREMGNYSTRMQLCEVLIDSSYMGVYVIGEKVKRDPNRVDIAKLTTLENSGDDLTGGYILSQNYWDSNNSFQSNYSPIDHPNFDVHFVYYYPSVENITLPQKEYIAAYMDSLESALYGADFMDSTLGYRNYLDVKSFIDYFLINELSRNNDGFKKSVFYNKDKNSNGGKLKAGPVWDFDWAYKNLYTCAIFENNDGSGWAHLINDCPTDNYSTGWYLRLMQDSTFNNELRCTYESYRETILDTTYLFTYIDSIRGLVHNAQARHFQKWPLLGVSGFAPEVEPIASTYDMELDKLKEWLRLRLIWLDENIPGHCPEIVESVTDQRNTDALHYYPNPGTGLFHFDGWIGGTDVCKMEIYDISGKTLDQISLSPGQIKFDYTIDQQGVYYFSISNKKGVIQNDKLIVLQR